MKNYPFLPDTFTQAIGLPTQYLHEIEKGRLPLTNRLRQKIASLLDRSVDIFHANNEIIRDEINRIEDPIDRMVLRILLNRYEFHHCVDRNDHLFRLTCYIQIKKGELMPPELDEEVLQQITKPSSAEESFDTDM